MKTQHFPGKKRLGFPSHVWLAEGKGIGFGQVGHWAQKPNTTDSQDNVPQVSLRFDFDPLFPDLNEGYTGIPHFQR